ncbi:MAG: NAD(P)H-dependent glycerol-3-phosphate dehydrogenase [Eubacteriales bacterium]|nr:NAD(P)H-dependent glycerol-3-phosphate dehydrogenase [Eubacteriales bacterium]
MKITVVGAGSWGMALASLLAVNSHSVCLWSWQQADLDEIKKTGTVWSKLPNAKLPSDIRLNGDLKSAVQDAELVVIAVPFSAVREILSQLESILNDRQIVLHVSKGIEQHSLKTLDEITFEYFPNNPTAILSGPSHAEEVVRALPTSVVIASKSDDLIHTLQDVFMNSSFRVYGSNDIKGVELGAAVKNVIALAAGISDGLGFGDNAKAALITRGMAEIRRLGQAMGADDYTFTGLSGMGDLIVTCTSLHSRNRKAGFLIGQGMSPQEAINQVGMVVEGFYSAVACKELAEKYQVEMPIVQQMNEVLFQNKKAGQAVDDLMLRNKKFE